MVVARHVRLRAKSKSNAELGGKQVLSYPVSGLDDRDILARTGAPDSLLTLSPGDPQKLATDIAISWSYGKTLPNLPILKQSQSGVCEAAVAPKLAGSTYCTSFTFTDYWRK